MSMRRRIEAAESRLRAKSLDPIEFLERLSDEELYALAARFEAVRASGHMEEGR